MEEKKSFVGQIGEAAKVGYEKGTELGRAKLRRKAIVAERLKVARVSAHLTQQEMSERINSNKVTYSGWESGRYEQPTEVLVRIADELKISLDYLAGRTDNPKGFFADEKTKNELKRLEELEQRILALEKNK